MARPVKKPPEQWREAILAAAKELFLEKGFEAVSVAEIMARAGGAKGMFYRCFGSKEELMQALGDRAFLENNPFDAVRERRDLNGLEKMRLVLELFQQEGSRNSLNLQSAPILKDPRILAAAVANNRRVLTPLWLELLREGVADGSVQTQYPQELAQLLPLIDFWLLPSVFPASPEEIRHRYRFVVQALAAMGLPLLPEAFPPLGEEILSALPAAEGGEER